MHESIDVEVWAVDRKGLFVANNYNDHFDKEGHQLKIPKEKLNGETKK